MSRARRALVAITIGSCAVLAMAMVPTTSGTLTGSISNQTNTAVSGIFNGPCTTTPNVTGSAYFVWPLDESAAATVARDTSGNARTGTYRNTGQITYGTPGPCPRDSARAVTLSGATNGGFVSSTTTTAIAGPQTFSAAIWFKTTSSTAAKLIGFGNASTGLSSSYDRHIYLTSAGNVVAGVYPNAVRTVSSPLAYRDDVWHLAVMTLAPSGDANVGLRLYVDGSQVASNTAVVTAQTYNGFWRVGFDNLNGWTTPTNRWFAGSVAYASVYTSALTAAQVTALYDAGR